MIKKILMIGSLLMTQTVTGQTCNNNILASTPDSRFVVNGNEVTDTATGLIWQRCTLGQTGSDCSAGSANSYTWQEALEAAGAGWRLPNINELRSIVEEKCYEPAINLSVFPNTLSSGYWSASPYASHSYGAWYVNFSNGNSYYSNRGNDKYVRLVRGGQ